MATTTRDLEQRELDDTDGTNAEGALDALDEALQADRAAGGDPIEPEPPPAPPADLSEQQKGKAGRPKGSHDTRPRKNARDRHRSRDRGTEGNRPEVTNEAISKSRQQLIDERDALKVQIETNVAEIQRLRALTDVDSRNALAKAMRETFQMIFAWVAMFRGEHWELREPRATKLGEAWAMALAPYVEKYADKFPILLALMETLGFVSEAIQNDARVREGKGAILNAPAPGSASNVPAIITTP